jgi:SNF2 family DNA or RNA helicase
MTSSVIVSKAHKQLLVPYTDAIKALWPDVKTLPINGSTYAMISHEPREQVRLRAAGLEVPAPILYQYDWENGTPFEVQKQTAAGITSHQRFYCLNDMGTGKTRSALWSWRYLNRIGVASKLLVVAPLSTLKFTWLKEIHSALPEVKAVVLHAATPQARRKLLAKNPDADIYIINHDGLKVIANELHVREDINFLVLDELAVYRNNSLRSKFMRVFAERFSYVIGMTGRPMPQAPTDVWAQCKILTPHTVPKYFRNANSLLMHQVNQYKWVPKADAVETALKWMRPSVRFSLDDVVELPPAIERTIDVELSPEQLKIYRKFTHEFAVLVQEKVITAANAGVAMNKLLQVGGGYVYTTNPEYVTLDSTPRRQVLLELIEQAEHKLIVFAPWRHLIEGLSKLLVEEEVDHCVIHGDTKKRDEILSAFQNTTRYRVLLAHPQCIHHGVTLTAADTVVWYSPVASLEIYEQACARIRRVGQQHKQQFLHLQATAVERRIYSLLRSKRKLQDEFLQLLKNQTGDENGEA